MSKISERIIVFLLAVIAVFSVLSFSQIKKTSDNVDLMEYQVTDLRIGVIDLQNKVDNMSLDLGSIELGVRKTDRDIKN